MVEIKYVVRFFKDDKYLYSIHCDENVLDDLISSAKEKGESVKVIAYKPDEVVV